MPLSLLLGNVTLLLINECWKGNTLQVVISSMGLIVWGGEVNRWEGRLAKWDCATGGALHCLYCHTLSCIVILCIEIHYHAKYCLTYIAIHYNTLPNSVLHWHTLTYIALHCLICVICTSQHIAKHCPTLPFIVLYLLYIAIHCHTLANIASVSCLSPPCLLPGAAASAGLAASPARQGIRLPYCLAI